MFKMVKKYFNIFYFLINQKQLNQIFLPILLRYGHRICTNCSHAVWKGITTLPPLTHLKLHRVIIDGEICKALLRMSRLTNLDLHYCSNVSDNIVNVCTDLAKRNPKRRFTLVVVSRGFVTYKPPVDIHNLVIDIKVACTQR